MRRSRRLVTDRALVCERGCEATEDGYLGLRRDELELESVEGNGLGIRFGSGDCRHRESGITNDHGHD